MQLQGDAQVQIDVERVVMRDERPGRRAPGDGLQAGGLHLAVALLVEILAHAADNLDPLLGPVEHFGAVDQVEIAMPQPEFDLLHSAPLVRMRQEGLAEVVNLVGEDRELAGLRQAQRAVHAEQVAEVELLCQGPAFFTHLTLADHDLNAARPILQLQEMRLAHAAAQDNAAGGAHARRRVGIVRRAAQHRDSLVAVEAAAPGIEPQLFYPAQVLTAAGLKYIFWHGGAAFMLKKSARACVPMS